jgi:hypothetical protein
MWRATAQHLPPYDAVQRNILKSRTLEVPRCRAPCPGGIQGMVSFKYSPLNDYTGRASGVITLIEYSGHRQKTLR